MISPSVAALALRNLFRQKLRTGITLSAIVFGVVGVILAGGFVADMFLQLGEATIHTQSGHLQVAKAGYFDEGLAAADKYRLADVDALRSLLSRRPEVEDVMARVDFAGLVGNGKSDWPVAGQGVEAGKEAKLGTHLRIVEGRMLTDADRYGIMLGHGVAEVLGLRPGDTVNLLVNTAEGALNTLEFEVVGVFETVSRDFDARAIRIPLPAALDLLAAPGINTLVVSLRSTQATDRVADALRGEVAARGVEVRTWSELSDFYDKTVKLYRTQFGVLQIIILAMVLLSVANTVNMSVFERIGEFGTMMALGNRPRDIVTLVLTESTMLGLAGSALGVLVGIAIALGVSVMGIPMPPPPNANVGYSAMIQVVPQVVALAALLGIAAAFTAAIWPAVRASRIPVVDALRANV